MIDYFKTLFLKIFIYFNLNRIINIGKVLLTIFYLIKRKDNKFFFTPLNHVNLKLTIIKLGPTFIKMAQILSTRRDFFSEDYIEELQKLQDKASPMNEKSVEQIINKEFIKENIFKEFDNKAIAVASIGQVHKAILKDGKEVVVKIKKENIKNFIQADLNILKLFYFFFKPLFSYNTRYSIKSLLDEFEKTIFLELNFNFEKENLLKFKKIYSNIENIYIPNIIEEISNENIIVLEYIKGSRIDDKNFLLKNNISYEKVLDNIIDFYIVQFLEEGFFHADPHPGNIIISSNGKINFIDFGMMKRVPKELRFQIIELIKYAGEEDYEGLVTILKKLKIVSGKYNEEEISELIERLFNIFNNKHIESINMQKLTLELLETMKSLPFKLPQNMIYIFKTLSIIEGLGTYYNPNFNGIKDIIPKIKNKIPNDIFNEAISLKKTKKELLDIPIYYHKTKTILENVYEGELQVKMSDEQINYLLNDFKEYIKPLMLSIMLFIGGFYFKGIEEIISGIFFGLGVLIFAYFI